MLWHLVVANGDAHRRSLHVRHVGWSGVVRARCRIGHPGNGYPFGGGTSIEFVEIYTHPDYDNAAFYLHDAGIVILSEPVSLSTYGTLAEVGLLDELARPTRHTGPVLHGGRLRPAERVPTLSADRVRYKGEVKLIDVNGTFGIPAGVSASFTNNPGKGNGSGGTCFGDSGGPIFHGDSNVVAALTSYGINANCAGTGGGYRVDTARRPGLDQRLPESLNQGSKDS
jgi:hypothetical protein